MTETLPQIVDTGRARTNEALGAPADTAELVSLGKTARTLGLSTAKNGHVTQCIAVADLLGADLEEVLEIPGMNKARPNWVRELDKTRWLPPALKIAWRVRKGKFLILASGRSVLPTCRIIKLLRGDNVFILFIGTPKKWTSKCADVLLRPKHERESDQEEKNQYPWNPKQVWVNAPICRPLPVSGEKQAGVAVLLGGLNITYGDSVQDYSDFLDKLELLVKAHPVRIVFSRRTKAEVKTAIEMRFGQSAAILVDAQDRQGFLDACEAAGAFVVTPDSITMAAEACATGKPVYIAEIPVKRRGTRNHRYIETSVGNGSVQPFDGTINFERRAVDRTDIEAARRDIAGYIEAWLRDPSVLSS